MKYSLGSLIVVPTRSEGVLVAARKHMVKTTPPARHASRRTLAFCFDMALVPLTAELSDAGGPACPNWQPPCAARIRSSDFVRCRGCHRNLFLLGIYPSTILDATRSNEYMPLSIASAYSGGIELRRSM